MENFPQDILSTILTFISSHKLLALRGVSKRLRALTDQTLFSRSSANDVAIQTKLAAHDPNQYLIWLQNPKVDLQAKLDSFVFAAKKLPASMRLSDEIFDRFFEEVKNNLGPDFPTIQTFYNLLPFMSDSQKGKILDQLLLQIKENNPDIYQLEALTALLPTLNDTQIVKLIKQLLNPISNGRLHLIEETFSRLEIKHKIFAVKFLTNTSLNSPKTYIPYIRDVLSKLNLQNIDRINVPTFAKLQEYLLSNVIELNRIALLLISMIKQSLEPDELTWLVENHPKYIKEIYSFQINFLADIIPHLATEVSDSYIKRITNFYNTTDSNSARATLSIKLPDSYAKQSIDFCLSLKDKFKNYAPQLSKAKLENLITRIESETMVIPTREAELLSYIASALTKDQIKLVLPRIYQKFFNCNFQGHEAFSCEYTLSLLEALVILRKDLSENEIKAIISTGIQRLEKTLFSFHLFQSTIRMLCNLYPDLASSIVNEYVINHIEQGDLHNKKNVICNITQFASFLTKNTATQLVPFILDNIVNQDAEIRGYIFAIMIECQHKFDDTQIKPLTQVLTVNVQDEKDNVKTLSLQALDCYLPELTPKEIIDVLPKLIALQEGSDINVFFNILPKILHLLGNKDCNTLFFILCDTFVKGNFEFINNPLNTIQSLQTLIPKLTAGWQQDLLAIIKKQLCEKLAINKDWPLLEILSKHMSSEQRKEFCDFLIDELPSNKINKEASLKTFFYYCEPQHLNDIYTSIKNNLENPEYTKKPKMVKILNELLDYLSPDQIKEMTPLIHYPQLVLGLVFSNRLDANTLKGLNIAAYPNTTYTQHIAEAYTELQRIIKIMSLQQVAQETQPLHQSPKTGR